MTVAPSIEIDPRQERELRRLLRGMDKKLARVKGRAIRRTTTAVRTRVVKAVKSDLNVLQRDLFQRGNSRRPIVEKLLRSGPVVTGGRVEVTGKRIPLSRFKARVSTRKGRAVAVSFQIDKGGGRKKITDKAFITTFPSGHRAVVQRTGRAPLPLMELFGPSVPEVALNHSDVERITAGEGAAILAKNMGQEINFLLQGRKGRA